MAWEADTVYEQWRDLNFGSWARQIESANATIIVAQFGQMEALDGAARLPEFVVAYHRLLDQFAARTRRLVLVSPMPFEQPPASHPPDLTQRMATWRLTPMPCAIWRSNAARCSWICSARSRCARRRAAHG
jgi:hypothetical protein